MSCCEAAELKHASKEKVASSSLLCTTTVLSSPHTTTHGSPSAAVSRQHRTATRTGNSAAGSAAVAAVCCGMADGGPADRLRSPKKDDGERVRQTSWDEKKLARSTTLAWEFDKDSREIARDCNRLSE